MQLQISKEKCLTFKIFYRFLCIGVKVKISKCLLILEVIMLNNFCGNKKMKSLPISKQLCCLQVGLTGKVVGKEHIEQLVLESIQNVQQDDPELLSSGRIKFVGKSIVWLFCLSIVYFYVNDVYSYV